MKNHLKYALVEPLDSTVVRINNAIIVVRGTYIVDIRAYRLQFAVDSGIGADDSNSRRFVRSGGIRPGISSPRFEWGRLRAVRSTTIYFRGTYK